MNMMIHPREQVLRAEPAPGFPVLSLAERDRRWNLTRNEMDRRGIDCLFIVCKGYNTNGNARWLDNADHSDRYLLFPRRGDPIIFRGPAHWQEWYPELFWEGIRYQGTAGGQTSSAAVDAISDLGYAKGTIGMIGLTGSMMSTEGDIPYLTFQNLRKRLPDARFMDVTDMLLPFRMFKSAEEIAMTEKAAEFSNLQIATVRKMARPGVSELDLFAEMTVAALKAGNDIGREHWSIMCSGKGYPTNRQPSSRKLRPGDMLCVSHYTRYGGYWAHPHTAMSLGPVEEEYRPMCEAVRGSIQRVLELLKPGTPWSEIDRAIDEPILKGGYYHEIPQIHGIGLDGHEPPVGPHAGGQVPVKRGRPKGSIADNEEWQQFAKTHARPTKDLVVREGMVLAIEVKAVKENRLFVEFGPLVVTEKSGPRVLTPEALDVIEL
jgi:Xaa-Pro aminopeptidase